jgi:hypothetical protein
MGVSEFQAKRVVDLMLASAKNYEKCILCGRLTKDRGIFEPNDENKKLFHSPDGKIRIYIYAICWRHANEETATLVEEHLIKNGENANNLTKVAFGGT